MSGGDISSALKCRKVVGLKQVLRALAEDGLLSVITADDADKKVLERVLPLATAKQVPVQSVPSKAELGRAAGIEVSAAVVGILK
ncbi:MAG: ribosomal L7Ae/L30e/S12e/Gadd45 family protein [Clostridiaceae bacterium]|jgi:large subunit ribosomal protein L7A|nr:ribosomal L7Ae/L30e/S12e/Gadd45 family protein [Clostridiaceae bacterium]